MKQYRITSADVMGSAPQTDDCFLSDEDMALVRELSKQQPIEIDNEEGNK